MYPYSMLVVCIVPIHTTACYLLRHRYVMLIGSASHNDVVAAKRLTSAAADVNRFANGTLAAGTA